MSGLVDLAPYLRMSGGRGLASARFDRRHKPKEPSAAKTSAAQLHLDHLIRVDVEIHFYAELGEKPEEGLCILRPERLRP